MLIDDNALHASLMLEAFQALRLDHDLHVVHDSDEALRLLTSAEAERLPALILVDLHMPKRDGFEVLSMIRSSPKLRAIPVIMMTSSDDADHVLRAYECCANAFLRKPRTDFVDLVGDLDRFWFRRAELPGVSPRT